MTYGVVSGKPMELPGSFLIGISYVEGFYEGLPHILPKIAPVLRKLVKMIGPGSIRQPEPQSRVNGAIRSRKISAQPGFNDLRTAIIAAVRIPAPASASQVLVRHWNKSYPLCAFY